MAASGMIGGIQKEKRKNRSNSYGNRKKQMECSPERGAVFY
jgi:hypothetical protein